MNYTRRTLPDHSVVIDITLPWQEVKQTYDKIFRTLADSLELPGFRKGQAPLDLAEKHIEKPRVYEEVLKELAPRAYSESVKALNIQPIVSPKVEVVEAGLEKDWQLKITTCERPSVNLGDYRKAAASLRSVAKATIWVPGKNKEEKPKEPTVGELLDVLYGTIKVDLPQILLEQETNRLLSHTYAELQKLGLTVEQYLQAQNKTTDQLKTETAKQAHKNLVLEFALEEIANKEGVTVESNEIDEVIQKAKTPQEKETLEKERYYLGSILRRQKTISNLLKPAVIKP